MVRLPPTWLRTLTRHHLRSSFLMDLVFHIPYRTALVGPLSCIASVGSTAEWNEDGPRQDMCAYGSDSQGATASPRRRRCDVIIVLGFSDPCYYYCSKLDPVAPLLSGLLTLTNRRAHC